ncbi:MAG TPA: plastocyanin/azurin family copper-binding protein [Methylocystis sp.]|nr:plastocyanin/azurin family copper-binding protein [Methylocystis sp.]
MGKGAILAALAVGFAPVHARAGSTVWVEIENFAFDPPILTLRRGDRAVFVNRDQVPHSVVGTRDGREIFRSPEQIDTDDTYSVDFEQTGEIVVGCGLHGRMSARIIVEP